MSDVRENAYGKWYIKMTEVWNATERTDAEVSFLLEHLQVTPESRILDVGCNGGRHSLRLARRGYTQVTGIDPDAEAIAFATESAQREQVNARFLCGAPEALALADFDAAFCIGTSIGFHDTDEGDLQQLRGIFRALRSGARFVLELTSLFAQRYGDGVRQNWFQQGQTFVLDEGHFDALTCRAHHIWRYIGDGPTHVREERYRVYAPQEILSLVARAGFVVREVYGDFDKRPFGLTSPSVIAVCDRP